MRTARRRIGIARVLLLLPFALLAVRAAHLSIVDERGERLGLAQTSRVLTLAPERGTIYDRGGVELALTMDSPSIYVIPSLLEDPDAAARALAKALGLSRKRVSERVRGGSGFRFVARWVEPARAERVRELSLAGVGVLEEPRRTYPHRALAAQVIGFVNIDGEGVRGVEQQEDDWLRGTARRLPVERDARGRLLVFEGDERWRTTGGDVALTLDATAQSQAQTALDEAVERTGARGGVVLSMDPRTGEILALAEAPGFDPNAFRQLDYGTTRSRAFLDASDPGSTLKAFLVAAALERRAIDTDDTFDCSEGTLRVPGKVIRDRRPLGVLDASGVLQLSSNVGAVKIAQALGPAAHFEMLRDFGFGSSTHSGFPDESAGVLRPWRGWKPLDHAAIAFGQGVSVTPVQLAAATAAIANGGRWLQPRLVLARRAAGSAWRDAGASDARRVLSPATAATVLSMLETVVGPEGTGRRAALEGVRVAGKTGTAQKFDSEAGTYSNTRYFSWFVGIVPADDPVLVILAGLDEARRPHHTGGAAAAPLFARVAAAQLAGFGILTTPSPSTSPQDPSGATPDGKRLPETRLAEAEEKAPAKRAPAKPRRETAAASREPRLVAAVDQTAGEQTAVKQTGPDDASESLELVEIDGRVLMPDFLGRADAEVKRLGETAGLRVEIDGRGRAIAQEPPAGTIVVRDAAHVHVTCRPGDAI